MMHSKTIRDAIRKTAQLKCETVSKACEAVNMNRFDDAHRHTPEIKAALVELRKWSQVSAATWPHFRANLNC